MNLPLGDHVLLWDVARGSLLRLAAPKLQRFATNGAAAVHLAPAKTAA